MPHIKVAPFDPGILDGSMRQNGVVEFRAIEKSSGNGDGLSELIGVNFEEESFVLELYKRKDDYLIKSEKSTRPLDVNRIKRSLAYLADNAGLRIVHSNINLSPNKPPLAEDYNKKIEDLELPDFGGRKIAVEVGFGSGRHLLHQARSNPDIVYIGIEIHTPSAQQVLKQIELQSLENVWVVNYDARLLLEMLPSNSAEMIYVHFPVPWDKKPHRRVINKAFVSEAIRVLDKGGALELRTDSDNYYEYALKIFEDQSGAMLRNSKNSETTVKSKYEERWLKQQKDIYTLTLVNQVESDTIFNEYDFSFGHKSKSSAELLGLPSQTILMSDHFVHFEKRYSLVFEDGAILKCSFGSFDRPEHKFIISSSSGEASYYPQPPVRSLTNYNAHKTIMEYINV